MAKIFKPLRYWIFPLLSGFLLFPFLLRAQDAGSAPSEEDKLLNVESEVNTEEWKQKIERELKDLPLEPEDFSTVGVRHPQNIRQAPAAITVLDEKDLQAYSIGGLEEILRIVPGMDVVTINPSYQQVGIRGFFPIGANTVLLLIDGREMNVNFLGGVFWNILPITLDDIKKIEIVRGPVSALYGANAFSGVINIITKKPQEERKADFISELGVYNSDQDGYKTRLGTRLYKAKGAFTRNRFGLKATVDYSDMSSLSNPEETSSRLAQANLRSHYDLSGNSQIDLDGGILLDDFRFYTFIGEVQTSNTSLGHLSLHGNWEKLSFKCSWYQLQFDLGLDIPFMPSEIIQPLFGENYPLKVKTDNFEAGSEYYFFLGKKDRLTLGADFLLNSFFTPPLVKDNNQEIRVGVFLQNEWIPDPRLNLNLALRYDYNSVTDQDYSPRASLVYTPDKKNTFRVSFARAFRKPAFIEYGMNLEPFDFLAQFLGPDVERVIYNPNLENEHINYFDLGYNTLWFRRLNLSGTVFYNQYRDIINMNKSLEYGNVHLYADSVGGELALDFIVNPQIKGFANYSYLHPIDKSQGEMLWQIKRFPQHKANAGLNWRPPWPGLSLSLIGSLIGPKEDHIFQTTRIFSLKIEEQKFSTQFFLGLRAGYSFLADRAEVGIKVFNLLDNNDRQYPGNPWQYDLDRDGTDENTNFGGEPLVRTITGFIRISW